MTNLAQLRHIADFMEDHGIGVGDHCDAPTLRAAADEIDRLRSAIAEHHRQGKDDKCWMDDDKLYAACGLPPKDHRVGDTAAMRANCDRYIEQSCIGGGPWQSYAELEAERDQAHTEAATLRQERDAARRVAEQLAERCAAQAALLAQAAERRDVLRHPGKPDPEPDRAA